MQFNKPKRTHPDKSKKRIRIEQETDVKETY